MAVLKLSPLYMPKNVVAIHLGTVRVPKPISETLTVLQMGMPPLLNLALPTTFPLCDWATIVITVTGVKSSTKPMLPIPPVGIPAFPYPPPPTNILVFPPWPAQITPVPGVTTVPTPRLVGLPLPGVPDLNIPPGTTDCFSLPGSSYELQFLVTPNPGQMGLKKWGFSLEAAGASIAEVILSANFISPTTPQSK